jgi:hypothetical protein
MDVIHINLFFHEIVGRLYASEKLEINTMIR